MNSPKKNPKTTTTRRKLQNITCFHPVCSTLVKKVNLMLYTFKTHTRTQAHTHKGWNMHAIIL